MWQITTNSSVAIADVFLQATLDDLQLTTNSSVYPPTGSPTFLSSANTLWFGVSSNSVTVPTSGGAFHYAAANLWPDGVVGMFISPPAALRIFSTASSSNILTLKCLQSDFG